MSRIRNRRNKEKKEGFEPGNLQLAQHDTSDLVTPQNCSV